MRACFPSPNPVSATLPAGFPATPVFSSRRHRSEARPLFVLGYSTRCATGTIARCPLSLSLNLRNDARQRDAETSSTMEGIIRVFREKIERFPIGCVSVALGHFWRVIHNVLNNGAEKLHTLRVTPICSTPIKCTRQYQIYHSPTIKVQKMDSTKLNVPGIQQDRDKNKG